jgi:hypothetical protein
MNCSKHRGAGSRETAATKLTGQMFFTQQGIGLPDGSVILVPVGGKGNSTGTIELLVPVSPRKLLSKTLL